MRRDETGTGRTVIHQETDRIYQGQIAAGAGSDHEIFYDAAADQIADNRGHYQRKSPEPAFFPEIYGDKDPEEQVKGSPEFGLSQKRENAVCERAGPVLVDPGK